MHAFIQIASHLHTYHLSSAALSPLLPQELMQNSGQRALGAAVFYDAAHKIAQSVRSFRRRPWKGFWDQIRKILLGSHQKARLKGHEMFFRSVLFHLSADCRLHCVIHSFCKEKKMKYTISMFESFKLKICQHPVLWTSLKKNDTFDK